PGVSGNPAGKRHGTKNKATMAAETLLIGEAESLTRKAIELAMSGDTVALRLCLDRIMPLRKGRPVRFAVPQLDTPADLVTALGAVAGAVSRGDLTPEEGQAIGQLLSGWRQALELTVIEQRLCELERKVIDSR